MHAHKYVHFEALVRYLDQICATSAVTEPLPCPHLLLTSALRHARALDRVNRSDW